MSHLAGQRRKQYCQNPWPKLQLGCLELEATKAKGIRCGRVSAQFRSRPRDCKRRALAQNHLPRWAGKVGTAQRHASQETGQALETGITVG